MDLATQISQLPGSRSGELAEILRSVSGNPEDIRAIATRWRSAAGTVSEQTGRVTTAVNDVDTAWEGASADAFDGYMGKYDKAGTALHDVLEDSAASLDTAAGALETAESEITSICNRLVEYADSHSDDRDAVATEVGNAIDAATPHKTEANTAVTTAMTKIQGYLDDHESTFAAIKAPGDQTFVPAPGHTVVWEPSTLPDDFMRTTYQSGGDGTPPGGTTPYSATGPGTGTTSYAGGSGAPPQPLSFAPGTATGDRIVEAARMHLGKPYVWGANGPSAFDCSGLVYYTLNQAGVKIGDTTAAGYQASGKPVSTPQPGDMVFFGHPAGHVGVYIGNGQMIHAPRPGSEVMVASVAADGRPVSYRRFT
ncbi:MULTISPECIES: WXG100 family type VII secretion target [Nonomuraea]|uniref:WXG100 family type VII secretion target n=2 Tax=Nonomuraea TaxID=83681 RepID=A0ABW1BNK3_9ACTN|nr:MULTISPECIES: WXG100 family type VII secretion target [Nonomuraea]MDA0647109.1 WXG100 family type VII secretion target [Nonomuraea ferruginea]